MRSRVIRWILRVLFTACAAVLTSRMVTVPYASLSPTMYDGFTAPLSRAATPTVAASAAVLPDTASAGIAEPTEPIPEPKEPEPGDIFALMYHDLTEDESKTTVWTTTPASMRKDLTELLALGYLPLSLEDYVTGNYEIGPDYFIVTFDDGYTSNLTLAEPLLREMGIPAAMFLITGSTELEGHLTWEELQRLQAGGVITIYTHTHTHADGLQMSTADFLSDVAKSWQEILTHLEEPEHKILSYPNGSHTRATMRALAEDGYEMFTIQSTPWWFEPVTENGADADGIRILVRMNIAYDADIKELVEINRKRTGQIPIDDKLEAIRQAEAEALAAERAERRAWMEKYGTAR